MEEKLTREIALQRFKAAKKHKEECAKRIVKMMTDDFIKETGKAPKYVEVW